MHNPFELDIANVKMGQEPNAIPWPPTCFPSTGVNCWPSDKPTTKHGVTGCTVQTMVCRIVRETKPKQ